MKITALVENTPGARGCGAAHGLSLYVETAQRRLLMDAGPSPLLAENAAALGIDLSRVELAVLSHGHYDHADGLPTFARCAPGVKIYLRRGAAEPYFAGSERKGTLRYVGISPAAAALPELVWVDGDLELREDLSLFTNVTGRRLWPEGNRGLRRRTPEGELVQDDFSHEQYLVVRDGARTVLLSGCAHNGILNILDRYREKFGGAPDAVISGFHMMRASGEHTEEELATIRATAEALRDWPSVFYTGHCTGMPAFAVMKEILGEQLQYLHSGDTVEL